MDDFVYGPAFLELQARLLSNKIGGIFVQKKQGTINGSYLVAKIELRVEQKMGKMPFEFCHIKSRNQNNI